MRWSLARPNVRFPRWGGTRTDTRIAYLTGNELRVVGGDGKGDRVLDRPRPPPRRPSGDRAPGHVLAYARRDGTVRVVNADTGAVLDRDAPTALEPSSRENEAAAVRRLLGASATSPSRCGRRTAAGSRPAGRRPTSSSSSASVGGRQIRAVSNVSSQFRSRSFPTISGWCCAP